jgi:hypothetical protein
MISFLVAVIVAFAGRQFYNLAIQFNKNRYLFGFVGIVSYFLGIFIGTFVITIAAPDFTNTAEAWVLTGVTIPAGVLSAVITYFALKRTWSS